MNCQDYEETLLLFNKLFNEGFYKPNFKTKKFNDLWYDVDMLLFRDALAGPFYQIHTHDNCDYVFEGKHESFKEIRSCEDFLNWCLNIIECYRNIINQVGSIDANEEKDKQVLLSQAAVMEKLSFIAFDIQKDRWRFIKKPSSYKIT
ncbi:hypothetical protein [uncultured Clostridium sp.]|uniref:hypothetical protein n=1 Tax=uncultured Clostridium sp. TaxID=59620 RepID=UPI0028EED176|nr:hypothetical protein [uncultured Clostridium sp.]